ncbi:MAG TPA: cbb3-type cytochrome c oxidase subunit II, partial [Thermoanaerobaculia bacterium]|nr:cbb3-type cytochrome c oxidase subunit II [Thermoanaerobaculia bacterium]
HGAEGAGTPSSKDGFPLAGRHFKFDDEKIASHVRETSPKPTATAEEGEDPDKDIPSVVTFSRSLEEGPARLSRFPAPIRLGGAVIDREACRDCHVIHGEGGNRGPAIQRVAGKRTREWLVEHFKEPKKLVPGSKMPSFRNLPDAELAAMSDYLLALP